MIEIKNIKKKINGKIVISDVSYDFKDGRIYGLYGRNASGKTMLIRAMSGLIHVDEGSVIVDGKSLETSDSFADNTGIIIENQQMLPGYSAEKNLEILSKIQKKATKNDIIESLKKVGLDPNSTEKVRKFSLGMKQRLNIAQAVFEHQKNLLLDEPTNALDESGIELMYKLFKEKREAGAMIVIATHHKEDLISLCDEILHIDSGKIIDVETREQFTHE